MLTSTNFFLALVAIGELAYMIDGKTVARGAGLVETCDCRNYKLGTPFATLPQRKSRIVRGTEAKAQEFPWQVSLHHSLGPGFPWKHICGGILISENYVLTAKHCVAGDLPGNLRVMIGTLDLRDVKNRHNYTVTEIDYPDQFNHEYGDDIAVLKVESLGGGPVKCSKSIQPICLGGKEVHGGRSQGVKCFISGWGQTDGRDSALGSSKLLYARVSIFDDMTCDRIVNEGHESHDRFDEDSMICAGFRESTGRVNPDSCSGDSGGPLVCVGNGETKAFLTGIVSWRYRRCGEGPSVYTRVHKYLRWVQDKTGVTVQY